MKSNYLPNTVEVKNEINKKALPLFFFCAKIFRYLRASSFFRVEEVFSSLSLDSDFETVVIEVEGERFELDERFRCLSDLLKGLGVVDGDDFVFL